MLAAFRHPIKLILLFQWSGCVYNTPLTVAIMCVARAHAHELFIAQNNKISADLNVTQFNESEKTLWLTQ